MGIIARKRSAYREAGHMVAAWRCGLKIRSARILSVDEFGGRFDHQSPLKGLRIKGFDRGDIRLDKAATICLAGPIAQKRFRPRSWRALQGRDDFDLATEVALVRSGDGEAAMAYLKEIGARAETLVAENWPFIEIFADRLLKQNTLSYFETGQIIEKMTLGHERLAVGDKDWASESLNLLCERRDV